MIYTLTNTQGCRVKVSSYGCMLMSYEVPDAKGNMGDIVLGGRDEAFYKQADTNYGGIVGRFANRISSGGFNLDDHFYPLPQNAGGNMHLHGGLEGFDRKEWKGHKQTTSTEESVILTYTSPDGEEGYPGNLEVVVTYTLYANNSLEFHCRATTDKTTVVSLSHHAYFHLGGSPRTPIYDHQLQIFASAFLSVSPELVPLLPTAVENTPFDFRKPKAIGKDITDSHEQLIYGDGYDHCFVLNGEIGQLRLAANVYEPISGRSLTVETTLPGLQFYTASGLNPKVSGKGGIPFQRHHAFCLEAQHFPNSPNRSDFPSPVLRPGEVYNHTTIFTPGICERMDA